MGLPLILQEFQSLFDILAEEDPGYRQVQILQDAGIIPVNVPHSDLNTGRPRGISANIPQSAIDDMMKEEDNAPNVPSQPEVINRDVI